MTGKAQLRRDIRPHCINGWGPDEGDGRPGCSYTGGHSCDLLAAHEGDCVCVCGSRCADRHGHDAGPVVVEARTAHEAAPGPPPS